MTTSQQIDKNRDEIERIESTLRNLMTESTYREIRILPAEDYIYPSGTSTESWWLVIAMFDGFVFRKRFYCSLAANFALMLFECGRFAAKSLVWSHPDYREEYTRVKYWSNVGGFEVVKPLVF